jgi:hypothetical protein
LFGNNLELAYAFIKIAGFLIVLTMTALLMFKGRNIYRQRKKEASLRRLEPFFLYVKTRLDENGEIRLPGKPFRPFERKVIEERLGSWNDRLEGKERERLTELCERLGLVDWNLNKLKSVWEWRRLEAAHALGMLRSQKAAPQLLEMLGTQKSATGLHIVARAAARCARDDKDLQRIVRAMAQRPKPSYRLIADILEDSGKDLTGLLTECLNDNDLKIVRIALLCMERKAYPRLSLRILNWVESSDKEIRILAVKALLHTGMPLSLKLAAELMNHPDWEIRAVTAKALGNWPHPAMAGLLMAGLRDENWWVRNNSAVSLKRLEEAGIFTGEEDWALQEDGPPIRALADGEGIGARW